MGLSLEELRAAIDRLDDQIIPLLNERARLAMEIGRIKHAHGDALYVPERERQVMRRLTARNAGPLPHLALTRIYREIMASALALEQNGAVVIVGLPEDEAAAALAYVAGGNTDCVVASSPEQAIHAWRGRADAMLLVTNSCREEVLRQLGDDAVIWRAGWVLEGPGGATWLHAYQRRGSVMVTGPGMGYCWMEASRGQALPPDWLTNVPVRSVEWLPHTEQPGGGMLVIRFDHTAEAVAQQYGDILLATGATICLV
ncbi:MAG TPA: chorismate mutase [Kiritimatiellia bacterium]|nr:chorismate mutase [Kiritimatiellia bacterium]